MERIARRTAPADLALQLASGIERLARELVGAEPTSRRPGLVRFRSRGSLAVCTAGAKRGSWFDHEAGRGGDALGLVAHLRGTTIAEALGWAMSWLGQRPAPAGPTAPKPAPAPLDGRRNHDTARRLWAEAVPPSGSPVEAYLRARGLRPPHDAPLRFHPACPRGAERLPAMVALMTDAATGKACGVHRTFLAPDGSGKAPRGSNGEAAKMMLGNAGVVRLAPDEEVTTGLGLAEGIETSLSVMQGAGWSPVWAACSAGGIARFPVLPGVEALTIFADYDDDGAGTRAAEACARRWAEAGREARIFVPPAGSDFHDAAGAVGMAA